jgi:hypothetical protein
MLTRGQFPEHVGCVKRTTTHSRWCVLRTLLTPLVAALLCSGCGGDRGPERVVVSGTVNYNGNPIPEGTIQFMPSGASAAPAAMASIAAGKYAADGKGGVAVGEYTLQIEAYRTRGQATLPAGSPPPPPDKFAPRDQYLPAKFNVNSTLKFMVPSGSRQITKDFDLKD